MTCCEMHRAAHIKLIAPKTPRNVLHFYESLERRGLTAAAIKAGLSDTCLCKVGISAPGKEVYNKQNRRLSKTDDNALI